MHGTPSPMLLDILGGDSRFAATFQVKEQAIIATLLSDHRGHFHTYSCYYDSARKGHL